MAGSNETYTVTTELDGCVVNITANFEFHYKQKGQRYLIFKGHMRMSNCSLRHVARCAVKVPRCLCASTFTVENQINLYKEASKTARTFSKNFISISTITFIPSCATKMDEVSRLTSAITLPYQQTKRCLKQEDPVLVEMYIKGDKGDHFNILIDRGGSITCFCTMEIEAFCHSSYLQSGEKFLLTGLKGVFKDDKYILTTPSIQSIKREYGPDDQGPSAIFNFFSRHKCNAMCRDFPIPSFPYAQNKIMNSSKMDILYKIIPDTHENPIVSLSSAQCAITKKYVHEDMSCS